MPGDNTSKDGEQTIFRELSISNPKTGNAVDLRGGLIDFRLYESILSNHITAELIIGETGYSVEVDNQMKNVLDGLPVRGGEPVRVRAIDPQGNEVNFTGKNALYVNKVRNVLTDTTRSIFTLDLCTKEYLGNEQTRVVKRYSGKISETVSKILTDVLKTTTPLDIEETSNSYNFIGNIKKPFYIVTWLASRSIPADGAYGKTAGFFFYETRDGFQYKSIETLVGPTKGGGSADSKDAPKYEFTQTDKLTQGYDGKILSWNINQNIDVQSKLAVGAYNTRLTFFNPYTFEVKTKDFSLQNDQVGEVKSAGTQLNFVAEEFLETSTRGVSGIMDVGCLPSGREGRQQLHTWKKKRDETNDKITDRMTQAITRYNQLFSISVDIMIKGNFEFKAGDMIYCAYTEPGGTTPNPQTKGLYVIASVCHKVTAAESYSTMNLIRDSFTLKPAPPSNPPLSEPEKPVGIMRALTGIADALTFNRFDFDKRGR